MAKSCSSKKLPLTLPLYDLLRLERDVPATMTSGRVDVVQVEQGAGVLVVMERIWRTRRHGQTSSFDEYAGAITASCVEVWPNMIVERQSNRLWREKEI